MCKKIILIALFAAFIFLFSCKNERFGGFDFFAMDTYVSVISETSDADIEKEIKDIVLQTEKRLSAHYEKSDIANLDNKNADAETVSLLSKAHEISKNTDGNFDYTLGRLSELWNINGSPESVPEKDRIADVLSHCGYEKVNFENGDILITDENLKIDLGAIAKGFTGDKIIACFKNNGINNAAVSLGGNIAITGSSQSRLDKKLNGWEIGINNPFETSEILGTVIVSDATVSVSGSYERFALIDGKKYHHIFDRKTGYPAESDLVSVAVICHDGTLADALSTALFVMGHEKACEFYNSGTYDFEAVFCTGKGKVYVTSGLSDSFVPVYDAKFSDSSVIVFPQFEK